MGFHPEALDRAVRMMNKEKKCKQCADPNLKGLHTCAKRRHIRDVYVENREDAMLVAARLVKHGFSFTYIDTDRGSLFRCDEADGTAFVRAEVRRA